MGFVSPASAYDGKVRARVAVYDSPPAIFVDDEGHPTGVFGDVLSDIAKSEGWELETVHVLDGTAREMLAEGMVDIVPALTYSEERGRKLLFTKETVLRVWGQVYVAEDSPIDTILNLEGQNIAVVTNDAYYEGPNGIRSLAGRFGVTCRFIEFDNYDQVLHAVESGQADAGVVGRFFGLQFEKNYRVSRSSILLGIANLRFAVSKASPLADYFVNRLDLRLAEMKNDDFSRYQQALAMHLGDRSEIRRILPQWVRITAAAGAAGTCLLLLASFLLRRQVATRTRALRESNTKLKENEARFRRLTDNARDVIMRRSIPDGVFEYVSPAALEIFGRPAEAFYRAGEFGLPESMYAEDWREFLVDQWREILRGARPAVQEYPVVHPSGEMRWMHQRNTYVTDSVGRAVAVESIVSDITAMKRSEEALRQSEERFRSAFENAPIGLALVDGDRRIVQANTKLTRMLDYRVGDLKGMPLAEIIVPEDRELLATHLDAASNEADGHADQELRLLAKDHGMMWVVLSTTTPKDTGERSRLHILQFLDVTEQRRAQQEKARMEATIRQQQKLEAIGTLASGVAHEINNPVQGILGYTELLAEDLPEGDPLREYTEGITYETERVATIVKNLLAFSRQKVDEGEQVAMAKLVNDTLSLVRVLVRNDQIRLKIDVPENLPSIPCRAHQIQQVLMNLITNARDALNGRFPGKDPDKIIHITAGIFERDGRQWVRTTIEDHGGGIPEEIRERIFDPFFTTKGKDHGTGLGLSVSHGIVRDHGGEFHVESKAGEWTRFHIDLPAARDAEIEDIETSGDEAPSNVVELRRRDVS
ncbi:MAG: PAS domain S-box protein [Deltaproteobacteria bacterium]|nr:PAS domain S-box protein [Deltaproteobacteria bacterium]MCB9489628.1 PAS domain S-box protein [Deltaproteobacteria bacterium]